MTDVYLYPSYDVDPDDVRLYYSGETVGAATKKRLLLGVGL